MYILVKVDATLQTECTLVGTYESHDEAQSALEGEWNNSLSKAIQDGFLEEDEADYACYTECNFGQIARPYGWESISFYIFNAE